MDLCRTVIEADGYLIVWADEDGSQGDLHANFKLSGSGESLVLTTAESWIVDQVDFPESEDDLGYARCQTEQDFVFQDHTFASNNDTIQFLNTWRRGCASIPKSCNERIEFSVCYYSRTRIYYSCFCLWSNCPFSKTSVLLEL